MNVDAAVIGGGLAGSAIAAGLADRGWSVVVVDPRQLPAHKVCGEFVSPDALGVLDRLGLASAVQHLDPVAIDRTLLVGQDGTRLATPLPAPAIGVSRHALDAALADAATDRGVRWMRASVRQVDRDETGWRLDAGITARCVVGAFGRHAPALQPAAHAAIGRWVGASCHAVDDQPSAAVEMYLYRGGYCGMSPVEGGRINICLLTDRDTFPAKGGAVAAIVQAAGRDVALARRLDGVRLIEDTACVVAPVDTDRPAVPWHRFARVGDAVAMIPPLCGDGMAMALQSAEICLPFADAYLRGDLPLEGWESGYTAAWHQAFDRRLRVGRLAQTALLTPMVGSTLLRLGRLLPWGARAAVRLTRGSIDPAARRWSYTPVAGSAG